MSDERREGARGVIILAVSGKSSGCLSHAKCRSELKRVGAHRGGDDRFFSGNDFDRSEDF